MSITRLTNCLILLDGKLKNDDLFIQNGKFINYMKIFYEDHRFPDITIDCGGKIISPGFIDIQINGGFGYDFAHDYKSIEKAVNVVAEKLLPSGVIGFCPTIVTSDDSVYLKVLNSIKKTPGGKHGAAVLGLHLEGPFISMNKRGAHNPVHIRNLENGVKDLIATYGENLDAVTIVTLAPELDPGGEVISYLSRKGIKVALGHSVAKLKEGEIGAKAGASLVTHLFNAMPEFHHRDPGLVGLLTSEATPSPLYFGIIADGVHTHLESLRIAYKLNFERLVLVTDAVSGLGLEEGKHFIGEMAVIIKGKRATIEGTNTLCGCVSSLDYCVRQFRAASNCSIEQALTAASTHPAKAIGLSSKGSLADGYDADFVILDESLNVHSTWIAGEKVWSKE